MPVESINYSEVLLDLRQRKAKLEAAIAVIEELIGQRTAAVIETTIKPVVENATPPVIGPYTGKTIISAATDFLRQAGRPQHISLILHALKQGGLQTNSKNLYRTVYNTLNQNLDKDIARTRSGHWGLKEWNQETAQK